jgi:hypothetical protein
MPYALPLVASSRAEAASSSARRALARVLVVAETLVHVAETDVPGAGERRIVDLGQQGGPRPERLEALGPRAHEVQGLRPAQGELEVQAIPLARRRRAVQGIERVL